MIKNFLKPPLRSQPTSIDFSSIHSRGRREFIIKACGRAVAWAKVASRRLRGASDLRCNYAQLKSAKGRSLVALIPMDNPPSPPPHNSNLRDQTVCYGTVAGVVALRYYPRASDADARWLKVNNGSPPASLFLSFGRFFECFFIWGDRWGR